MEYERGKPAVLTISDDDGNVIDEVNLFDIKTSEDIHQMMIDKGFKLKPDSEIATMRARREKERDEIEAQKIERRDKLSRKLKEDRLKDKQKDMKEEKDPVHVTGEEKDEL